MASVLLAGHGPIIVYWQLFFLLCRVFFDNQQQHVGFVIWTFLIALLLISLKQKHRGKSQYAAWQYIVFSISCPSCSAFLCLERRVCASIHWKSCSQVLKLTFFWQTPPCHFIVLLFVIVPCSTWSPCLSSSSVTVFITEPHRHSIFISWGFCTVLREAFQWDVGLAALTPGQKWPCRTRTHGDWTEDLHFWSQSDIKLHKSALDLKLTDTPFANMSKL